MYAASKTALIGLIRSVGAEAADMGLHANLINSLLDAEHVAKVVGWLASEYCDLNGEIMVAGGDTVEAGR